MSGPFDTSHLRGEFFREVDDDATAAALQAAMEAGQPLETVKEIYVERCRIKYAGDPKTVTVFNAHDNFQYFRAPNQRHGEWFTPAQFFPDQYERFKQGLSQIQDGIPIEELPFVSAGMIETLQSLEITTCEALAGLEGSRLMRLGPHGRAYQRKAAAYLEQSKIASEGSRLAGELKKRDQQIAELNAKVEKLLGNGASEPATEKAGKGGAKPADKNTPPAHLKGAAKAAWLRRQAAAEAVEEKPPAKAGKAPPATTDARAMLEAMEPVDLRNMLEAYGKTPPRGATKADLVELMVEVNEKAERGLKATADA